MLTDRLGVRFCFTLRHKSSRGARDMNLETNFYFKAMAMQWSCFLLICNVTECCCWHESDEQRTLTVFFDLLLIAKHSLRVQGNVPCSCDGRRSPEWQTISS